MVRRATAVVLAAAPRALPLPGATSAVNWPTVCAAECFAHAWKTAAGQQLNDNP
ncbi:hypothetical protein [Streptomyces sp. NEAU-W12]|uniref:hypothetical protein n=1 Tax=Streptomyces sp. NEAU-W12 TaxID=2994668 RepID=UPI00224A63E7|nr:hypothetical protein [Streptomyces sp. NEAU-W12]MCX2923006.1 hypothetical protein [Streptomyces sp. NEAU-W12]